MKLHKPSQPTAHQPPHTLKQKRAKGLGRTANAILIALACTIPAIITTNCPTASQVRTGNSSNLQCSACDAPEYSNKCNAPEYKFSSGRCVLKKEYMYCNVDGTNKLFKKDDPKNPCNANETECRSKGKYFDFSKNQAGVCIDYKDIEPFVVLARTTENDSDRTVILTVNNRSGNNIQQPFKFEADCGEGGTINSGTTQTALLEGDGYVDVKCKYSQPGNHIISLTGRFRSVQLTCFLGEEESFMPFIAVLNWGGNPWQHFFHFANQCYKFSSIPTGKQPILTHTTIMQGMFSETMDFQGDLSKWDVSNVTNMAYMFSRSTFNGDISNWDVSNVTDMSNMFSFSMFNTDISRWDVRNVKFMDEMFAYSLFNNDISRWDVSSVTNISKIFFQSDFTNDISGWQLNNLEDASQPFENTEGVITIEEKNRPAALRGI